MTIDFATLLKLLQPILAIALAQLAPGSTGAILVQLLIQIVSQPASSPNAFGAAHVHADLPPHPWTAESLEAWAAEQAPGETV